MSWARRTGWIWLNGEKGEKNKCLNVHENYRQIVFKIPDKDMHRHRRVTVSRSVCSLALEQKQSLFVNSEDSPKVPTAQKKHFVTNVCSYEIQLQHL